MNITIDKIKSYNPCQDGIDNFESKYPKYNNTLEHLLSLEDISYSDKIWLASKVLDKDVLVQWSVDCAEFVVDNYNDLYPEDSRVLDCIEAVKLHQENKITSEQFSAAESAAESAVLSAARLAVRSAAESAALSAVRSAAELAAESVAWSASSAAELVAESATWSAAESARLAVGSAAWSAESAALSAAESVAWSASSAAELAAESAVWTTESARSAEKEQEDINLSLLIALL